MSKKAKNLFLILVLVQGLHSVEEYLGELWENFPPAAFLTGLLSDNLETGFLMINIGLFLFGVLCWLFPVLRNYSYARAVVWFWIILEIINGIGHPIWSLVQAAYTPGLVTAPVLLTLSIVLLYKQQIPVSSQTIV